jgi:Zn-finger nucleic acid-binding protein
MNCPVCRNAMITCELENVEIDHCPDCGGIWLDAGELELLLGAPQHVRQLLDSFKTDIACPEKPRKCPICLKKMQKIIVGLSRPKILIDKCPKNNGLWFDKNELKDVLTAGSFDKENKITKILTDMFRD